MDNILTIMAYLLKTSQEVQKELSNKFKQKRLDKNLTQEGLSERSGVSLGTLKRFENTGQCHHTRTVCGHDGFTVV